MPDDGTLSGTSLWRGLGKAVLDLFYPSHCVLCGCRLTLEQEGGEGVFCQSCMELIPRPQAHPCPVCSHPMEGAISCTNCGGRPWHLSTIVPACRYEGVVQGLIQRFKYGRDIVLARPLGILLQRSLDDERLAGRIFDALVPVPLHPLRRRERGFNQAELLAAQLSRVAGIPVRRLIRRSRATPPQAAFDRVERMENLRDAFALRRPIPPGGAFLLVDDVSTTGATLDACAAVLRDGGASEVFAVVVARG